MPLFFLKRSAAVAAPAAVAALLAACTSGDVFGPYRGGDREGNLQSELGRGRFTLICQTDDLCDASNHFTLSSNRSIAAQSSFDVRYERLDATPVVTVGADANARYGTALTIDAASERVVTRAFDRGAGPFRAVDPGLTALLVYDGTGMVIDYAMARVAQPTSLALYTSMSGAMTPVPTPGIVVREGQRRAVRAVAQENKEVLFGYLPVEWSSTNPDVIAIDNTATALAVVVAQAPGTATVQARFGQLTASVRLEVSP